MILPEPLLRLGTRQSNLALAQSGWVARQLEDLHPGLRVELVAMDTRGDRFPGDLAAVGGKGLFTQELEAGLRQGELDLAVHSLKDLPVALAEDLVIAAYPRREDPRDVLISQGGGDLSQLPAGARILTGALRRRAQIRHRHPRLQVLPVRGNVETRLGKWRQGQGEGVILAAAGLRRLGLLTELPAHCLDPEQFLPAPGQGTLAVQVRRGSAAEEVCRLLDDEATAAASQAERFLVAAFGGDCTLPLAAWARLEKADAVEAAGGAETRRSWRVSALLALPEGDAVAVGEGESEAWQEAADACLEALHRQGAQDILARLRS
jgi:hydroxymethylbilane synthase